MFFASIGYTVIAIGARLGMIRLEPLSFCRFARKGPVPHHGTAETQGLFAVRVARAAVTVAQSEWASPGPHRKRGMRLLTSQRADLEAGPQEQGSKVTDGWPTRRAPWKSKLPRE